MFLMLLVFVALRMLMLVAVAVVFTVDPLLCCLVPKECVLLDDIQGRCLLALRLPGAWSSGQLSLQTSTCTISSEIQ